MSSTLTFQRALLSVIALALLAGVVPAGLLLDRQLASALETRARSDLALAPRVFGDRQASTADAMMMHAKEFAHSSALADALVRGDREGAKRIAENARASLGGEPIVVGPTGEAWTGPAADAELATLLPRTRRGEMPVATLSDGSTLNDVALAPVEHNGRWIGAAGVAAKVDGQRAAAIAGLTRADVMIVAARVDRAPATGTRAIAASTLDSATMIAVVRALPDSAYAAGAIPARGDPRLAHRATVHELTVIGRRLIAATAPIGDAGTIVLVRDLNAELAVLPRLRWLAFSSALAALVFALALGFVLATRITRPVHDLASAADALARGDFGAPIPKADAIAVREVSRLAAAFETMRSALAERIAELHDANDALADRNTRLTALQADLVQRERLVATGRLVTQLAHEIRNPVASLRNCLELIRRRLTNDAEGREFADIAIDELLRMHELAEQMLDMNRPRDAMTARCCPTDVVRNVVALLMAGAPAHAASIRWSLENGATGVEEAAISADALKQVLLNLAQNGRDAIDTMRDGANGERHHEAMVHMAVVAAAEIVSISVYDDGPGIADDILPTIFDPFFTTKRDTRGVGLGLSIADGLIRSAGGRLTLVRDADASTSPQRGACFLIELPRVQNDHSMLEVHHTDEPSSSRGRGHLLMAKS